MNTARTRIGLVAAAALMMSVAVGSQAAGVEKLRACLEKAEASDNPRLETSTCYWNHNQYMASYGK